MTVFRDVILILIAIALVIAVFIPSNKNNEVDGVSKKKTGNLKLSDKTNANSSHNGNKIDIIKKLDRKISPRDDTVFHKYFPLKLNSEWKYLVNGSKDLVNDTLWTIKVKREPSLDLPGILLIGFGSFLQERSVSKSKTGGIIFDGLPFIAPFSFLNNRPINVEGEFLPSKQAVIKGAMWKFIYFRNLSYRSRNSDDKIVDENADSVQTDIVTVKDREKIIVPAGIFKNAIRVEYLSRLEMKAKGRRSVLNPLTVKPYRRDTIWFAPGIGMVKRRVSYINQKGKNVTFVLNSYTRP